MALTLSCAICREEEVEAAGTEAVPGGDDAEGSTAKVAAEPDTKGGKGATADAEPVPAASSTRNRRPRAVSARFLDMCVAACLVDLCALRLAS